MRKDTFRKWTTGEASAHLLCIEGLVGGSLAVNRFLFPRYSLNGGPSPSVNNEAANRTAIINKLRKERNNFAK